MITIQQNFARRFLNFLFYGHTCQSNFFFFLSLSTSVHFDNTIGDIIRQRKVRLGVPFPPKRIMRPSDFIRRLSAMSLLLCRNRKRYIYHCLSFLQIKAVKRCISTYTQICNYSCNPLLAPTPSPPPLFLCYIVLLNVAIKKENKSNRIKRTRIKKSKLQKVEI